MKKYLVLCSVAYSTICIISCNGRTGPSGTAQKNLEVAHSINQCFDNKDFSKLGDYIASDAVDHGGENGDIRGLDNLKSEFEKSVAGLSSQKTEIVKELADDEYVMAWSHFTGTFATDGKDHKTGDKIDMNIAEVTKFKDGKASEHWVFLDPKDIMKMMPPQKTDSTKKM
ncbi:MAG TPA: ester cyclase [Puia sp.]|nr:ester cyclase [Puia sp.]